MLKLSCDIMNGTKYNNNKKKFVGFCVLRMINRTELGMQKHAMSSLQWHVQNNCHNQPSHQHHATKLRQKHSFHYKMNPYLFKKGLCPDLGDFIVDPKLTMTTGPLSKSNIMHKAIQITTISTNKQAFTHSVLVEFNSVYMTSNGVS